MSDATSFKPTGQFGDHAGMFNGHAFLVQSMIDRTMTTTLAMVTAVTNAGELAAVGFVDVQPLVNQVDAAGQGTPHGVIHGLPYFRLQGGTDAVILDPKVGDIGIVAFAREDVSSVKTTKARANPASNRRNDWADGLYLGGVLNGVPAQYLMFAAGGIMIVSPAKITVQAPLVEVDAAMQFTVTAPIIALNGDITQTGGGTAGGTVHLIGPLNVVHDVTAGTISLENHIHTDPQGGNTGSPVP